MTRIDWTVIAKAAGIGLAVILPGALISGVVADRSGTWIVWVFLAVVLAGFGLCGLVAGRLRNDTPMIHGAIGASAAFVAALTAGLALAAVRDRSISLAAIPVGAVLAVTAGVAGSLLADLSHRRSISR